MLLDISTNLLVLIGKYSRGLYLEEYVFNKGVPFRTLSDLIVGYAGRKLARKVLVVLLIAKVG